MCLGGFAMFLVFVGRWWGYLVGGGLLFGAVFSGKFGRGWDFTWDCVGKWF